MTIHRIKGDWTVEEVINGVLENDLESLVVIGWRKEPDEDGKRFYVASTYEECADTVYAIQQGNLFVLENCRQ